MGLSAEVEDGERAFIGLKPIRRSGTSVAGEKQTRQPLAVGGEEQRKHDQAEYEGLWVEDLAGHAIEDEEGHEGAEREEIGRQPDADGVVMKQPGEKPQDRPTHEAHDEEREENEGDELQDMHVAQRLDGCRCGAAMAADVGSHWYLIGQR